jgi:hypothetical protein
MQLINFAPLLSTHYFPLPPGRQHHKQADYSDDGQQEGKDGA